MSDSHSDAGPHRKGQPPMTEELLALLRHRLATRFYDQPQVIDAIARAILASRQAET